MMKRSGHRSRQRVGLVLADLDSGAGQSLWPAVAGEAERGNCDFYCFPGGRLGRSGRYDASRNSVFALASSADLDGLLLWPSSISGIASGEALSRFIQGFAGKPLVLLSSGFPDIPTVSIDYYAGMRTAIRHLLHHHHLDRIAFLRGPELHEGAQERYHAYSDELKDAGLQVDSRLVSSPWFWDEGEQAVLELLEGRGLVPGKDFQAIAASSDLMGLFAVQELQRRGWKIPGDLAVIGMNDSVESRIWNPGMTTARCPFARLGREGFRLLDSIMRGERPDRPAVLEPELVIRESCGCRAGTESVLVSGTGPELASASGSGPALVPGKVPPASQALAGYEAWVTSRRDLAMRELSRDLLMSLDARSLGLELARGLPPLGSRSAAVCRFESGTAGTRARLVAGFAGTDVFASAGDSFPCKDLLPEDYLPDGRVSCIVEPLFFHAESSGYALFGLGAESGAFYESLRDAVSGALRSMSLIGDIELARERAERADAVKTHFLSNVSRDLRHPAATVAAEVSRLLALSTARLSGASSAGASSAGASPAGASPAGESALLKDVESGLVAIRGAAEKQLALVNDLRDLARAETGELEIRPVPFDPLKAARSLLEASARRREKPGLAWVDALGDSLPLIVADREAFSKMLGNLLDNAGKFTSIGEVTLEAGVELPFLVFRVRDTGPGIPQDRKDALFDPFVSAGGKGGLGLGLGLARHLALLHHGRLEIEETAAPGACFTLALPLSRVGRRGPEGLSGTGFLPGSTNSGAVIWRLEAEPGTAEREVFRAMAGNPVLASFPFLCLTAGGWRDLTGRSGSVGMSLASFVGLELPERRSAGEKVSLVVSPDPDARNQDRILVETAFPGSTVLVARSGEEARRLLDEAPVGLALVDHALVNPDCGTLLSAMAGDPELAGIPVCIRASGLFSLKEVPNAALHPRLAVRNRAVLEEGEAVEDLRRFVSDSGRRPVSALQIARRAILYLNVHLSRGTARWKLAAELGVSEDYVSRIFRVEVGLTPWEYLNRLRVVRARDLLRSGDGTVAAVASSVGIEDQAYFSRLFRKRTGMTPWKWREQSRAGYGSQ